jgi:glycerophosphoryl diester phosphodiesterase
MYIVVGIIVLIIGLNIFFVMGYKPDYDKANWLIKRSFAHRGLFEQNQAIPENSMPAFKRAVDAGYGIELDVALTKDDMVAVFHDDRLKRMTGVDKGINQVTYAELRSFKLADTEYNAPLFREVLELVDGKVPLIVEIKNGKKNDLLCSKVLDMLKGYEGEYCIESFNPFIVRWFKRNAPGIIRGQLSMKYKGEKTLSSIVHFVLENLLLNFLGRPNFIAYKHTDCNKACFKINHRFGVVTVAWTIESQEEMNAALKDFDSVIFQYFSPSKTF